MIQRIQTVYMLLTSFLSIIFLNGNFIEFKDKTGKGIVVNFKGIMQILETEKYSLIRKEFYLPLLMILISVLSFSAVFLYKRRKLQSKLTFTAILLAVVSIAMLIYYAISMSAEYVASVVTGIKLIIPLLILLFSILAYRGIIKDENLVRSYDRLR